MFNRNDFDAFVAGLGLRYFTSDELLAKTDRAFNTAPPARLWANIAPTILVLDQLRDDLGAAIRINSVYRSHEYNRRLRGSVPLSQHVAFNAIDFSPRGGVSLADAAERLFAMRDRWFSAPSQFSRAEEVVETRAIRNRPLVWRDEGSGPEFRFRGGVSEYSNFIHIDTRGENSTW